MTQHWAILKAVHGLYLNSPKTYVHFGVIADDSMENAIIRACFLCGSSEVKIAPVYEYIPGDEENG